MSPVPRRLRKVGDALAIPQLGGILCLLQGLGFIFTAMDPVWRDRLALYPDAVLAGEVWRCVTFLSLPLAQSPIWILFALWFLYFVARTLEDHWGSAKFTLYVLASWLSVVTYSLAFDVPVVEATRFEAALFLAAAASFPRMEITLFFVVPVRLGWLGWFTGALLAWDFFNAGWGTRGYLIASLAAFFAFFARGWVTDVKSRIRRARYRAQLRDRG